MRPELIEDCGLLCHLLLVQEVGLEIVDLLNLGVNRRWLSRDEPEGRYYDKGAEHNLEFHALFYTPEIGQPGYSGTIVKGWTTDTMNQENPCARNSPPSNSTRKMKIVRVQ